MLPTRDGTVLMCAARPTKDANNDDDISTAYYLTGKEIVCIVRFTIETT